MTPVIYTIAKNESHNVADFMAAAEGVSVYVLDTGSFDNTVELLKKAGAHVTQKIINPWRYDHARNEALNLVPNDDNLLCVSVDMDERLETNWVSKLKQEWISGANIGNYRYIGEWADLNCTVPAIESARTRIHSRKGFHWERPVHEIPVPDKTTLVNICDTSILVKHYSDKRPRDYEPLLTEILENNPMDAEARLQRAAEFMKKHSWDCALIDYKSWLKLNYTDDSISKRYQRAAVFIDTAVCYYNLGQMERCLRAFLEAVAAEPNCREAWVHLATAYDSMGDYVMALACIQNALKIKSAPYFASIDITCWGDYPINLEIKLKETLKCML
jgi:tetratricopeptide (TPR) repeat protein